MTSRKRKSFQPPRMVGIRWALMVAMWLAAAITSSAQTFTVLVNFNVQQGTTLFTGPLIQGIDGNFYDTNNSFLNGGGGSVFKVSPAGELTTLYKFCSLTDCADGNVPSGGLVLAANGVMYGTTLYGGANPCPGGYLPGCGTIFQIGPDRVFATLYNFAGTDGAYPMGPLVQGTDGNLYGATVYGGNLNTGTVFMITPAGKLTTLYDFCNSLGCFGADANALIQGTDGNFYGTTAGAGNDSGGTVFQITPQGALTTYNLCTQTACDIGSYPYAPLVQASNGNFYGAGAFGGNIGTTPVCGQSDSLGYGGIFEITPGGTLTGLYTFQNSSDGSIPVAALIQATDGNLYGTTGCGGNDGAGTIYSITPGGTFTSLYSFTNPAEIDLLAQAGLLQGTDGNFYGTTPGDGANDNGTVFKFSVGLGPFVKTLPISGGVGTVIQILGTSLTGSTAVSFNGIPAAFTVVSDTDIQATVATGATTGVVTVTTAANGALSSNQAFQVTTQVATPVFSPAAGLYPSAQTVAISDGTPAATIYYTTDGSTPTTSSAVYSAPIPVALTETIQAIATASGYANSPLTSAAYGIETPAPTLSLAGGIYASAQTVTISDVMAGTTIYYTLGGTPNTSSLVYSGPITVSATETLEAIAVGPGLSPSTVVSAQYIIGAPFVVIPTTAWLEVSPGGSAAYTLTLTASGVQTIPVAVSFSASGLPSGANATFSPNPVAAGAANATVTLTIQTSSSSARINAGRMGWAATLCILFVPLTGPVAGRRRWRRGSRRKATGYVLGLFAICTISALLAGCGKLSELTGNAPSSHTYTITVTATGGGTTATTTVMLKVRG